MINIFTKHRKELTSDIDTWVVEWKTYKFGVSIEYPRVQKNYQCFTDVNEAQEFANALNKAMKLLEISSLPYAVVKKQEHKGIN